MSNFSEDYEFLVLNAKESSMFDPNSTPPPDFSPPTFTLPQIITQLQTQWGGTDEANGTRRKWSSSTITYSITNLAPTNVSGYTAPEASGLKTMTAKMIATAAAGFELWDDLIAPSLNQSSSAAANITFNYSSNTDGGGT